LRVAPALALRRRSAAPDPPPSRAPDVLPGRLPALVARRPRPPLERREGRLPVRGVRAREPARPAARAAPEQRLPLLPARPPALGAVAARRPAACRSRDGRRAGGRLLLRVRALPDAVPTRGGARGREPRPRLARRAQELPSRRLRSSSSRWRSGSWPSTTELSRRSPSAVRQIQ